VLDRTSVLHGEMVSLQMGTQLALKLPMDKATKLHVHACGGMCLDCARNMSTIKAKQQMQMTPTLCDKPANSTVEFKRSNFTRKTL
jgi:hypothetical protein